MATTLLQHLQTLLAQATLPCQQLGQQLATCIGPFLAAPITPTTTHDFENDLRQLLDECGRQSVVSGLCWRYHRGMRETFAQIHDGAVGDITALQCNYLTGTLWHRERQQAGCHQEVKDYVFGTRGRVDVIGHQITGERPWQYPRAQARRDADMYQQEHNELFASIRNNRPINNGDYMSKPSLMGIMGRMACYTGRVITWDQALNSQEVLGPQRLEWGPIAVPPVAMPGQSA